MESYESLERPVVASNGRSTTAVLELLKYIRMNKLRKSDDVMRWGKPLLDTRAGFLGDDKWTVLEQVCVAALDTCDLAYAKECLDKLIKQFPDSSRVNRLVGMMNEATGEFQAADETYDKLIEANGANQLAHKRKICVLKAQGKLQSAVKELNEYLRNFESDIFAWQELADIYLSVGKYDAAAFCFEELVLSNPMNHLYFCRLGEIYYTMGTEHLLDSRKYFSKSLELKRQNNPRALHGLAACCNAIACSGRKVSGSNASVNQALHQYAVEELTKLYNKTPGKAATAALAVLQTQSEAVNA